MSAWKRKSGLEGYAVALVCAVPLICGFVQGCWRSDESGRGDGTSVVMDDNASYAALRAENEALRRENQLLRRELISKNGALPDSVMPEKGSSAVPEIEVVGEDTGYWLSANSKVRHNKRCRNYRRVKGHPCGPKDGRPCKACGG